MVDFEKVRIFYHVMKEGNLTRACKTLNKGTSTVSKHLRDLEDNIGQKIYIRKHQRYELTDKGRELFSLARSTIPSLEEGLINLNKEASLETLSTITILTTTGMAGIWLLGKINTYSKINKNIQFKIIATNEHVDFVNTKADIAVLPKIASQEEKAKIKILTLESQLYASKEYLNIYGIPTCIQDLSSHKLIGYYSDGVGTRGNVDWHLNIDMPKNSIRTCWLSINSAFFQIEAARLGLGIVAIPDVSHFLIRNGLVLILPEIKLKLDSYLFIRNTDMPSSEITKFTNFIANK